MCWTLFFVQNTVSLVSCEMAQMAGFADVRWPYRQKLALQVQHFQNIIWIILGFHPVKNQHKAFVKQKQNLQDQINNLVLNCSPFKMFNPVLS